MELLLTSPQLLWIGFAIAGAIFLIIAIYYIHHGLERWNQSQNFLFLLLLVLAVPATIIALRQATVVTIRALAEVKITASRIERVGPSVIIRLTLSQQATAYLKIKNLVTGKTALVLPSYGLEKRSDHEIRLDQIPPEGAEVVFFINGKETAQEGQPPLILQAN